MGWLEKRSLNRGLGLRLLKPLRPFIGAGLMVLSSWAAAAVLMVGPGGAPMSMDEALRQAQDGDTIELLSGDYTGAPVVIENRRLLIRGVGKRPLIKGSGKMTSAKALWLVRGGDVTLENLEFRGARSNDGEGAGIRMEGGRLRCTTTNMGCLRPTLNRPSCESKTANSASRPRWWAACTTC